MRCTEMYLSHPVLGSETEPVPAIHENNGEKRNFEWLYQENLRLLHKVPYVLLCLYTIATIIIIIIESSRKIILGRLQFLAGLRSESPFHAVFSQWGGSPILSPSLTSALLYLPPYPHPICATTNGCVDADNRLETETIWLVLMQTMFVIQSAAYSTDF